MTASASRERRYVADLKRDDIENMKRLAEVTESTFQPTTKGALIALCDMALAYLDNRCGCGCERGEQPGER